MPKNFTICIGTVGAGVWQSSNGGDNWRRSRMKLPFQAEPGEIDIRALALDPSNDARLYAGSEAGIYVSNDKGASWEYLDSPMDGDQIWSIAVHPENPDIVLAGTKPPVVYRSDNAGKSWAKMPIAPAEACLAGPPKVTNIVFDPRDPDTIWVGVEIDGVYRSRDGGANWEHLPPLGSHPINQDIHAVRINPDGRAPLLAATPDGIWQSTDEGMSWQLTGFPKFFDKDQISYCRGIGIKADEPDTIFVGNGDFIPGKIGAIQRSVDGGESWAAVPLPHTPNSTIYGFATHPATPEIIVAHSLFGYVYTSMDGGGSWEKCGREFNEIRAIALLPN